MHSITSGYGENQERSREGGGTANEPLRMLQKTGEGTYRVRGMINTSVKTREQVTGQCAWHIQDGKSKAGILDSRMWNMTVWYLILAGGIVVRDDGE